MGEHKRVKRRRRIDGVALRRRATQGAIVGAVLGGLGLLVGLARASIALLSGTHVVFGEMLLVPTLYIGGFAFAGACVGALAPVSRGLVGRFVVGFLAAAIVSTFLARAMDGPLASWGRVQFQTIAVMTAFFGLIAGYLIGKDR